MAYLTLENEKFTKFNRNGRRPHRSMNKNFNETAANPLQERREGELLLFTSPLFSQQHEPLAAQPAAVRSTISSLHFVRAEGVW